MPAFYDLAEKRFGRLLVIKRSDEDRSKWICNCDCGNITSVITNYLTSGRVTNCGCYNKINKTHGMTDTPEYTAWTNMIQRCFNPNCPEYFWYGQRGIIVCNEWRNSFPHFFLDMGYRPSPEHSLDRYPNMNGNYEPGNCRWATTVEQASNTRRNVYYEYQGEQFTQTELARRAGMSDTMFRKRVEHYGHSVEEIMAGKPVNKHIYTYQGETKKLTDWAKHFGIRYSTLYGRVVEMGWSFEKAVTTK